MSVRTMARVWDLSQHAGTELLMLLAIADFADDDGNAYPAVSTLAEKCRMKTRNANYILSDLQKSGELDVLVNEGPKGTNRYKINVGSYGKGLQRLAGGGLQSGAGVQSSAGLHSSAPTPAMECSKPLHPIADEPSLNHQEPPVSKRVVKANALDDLSDLLVDVDKQVLSDWLAVRKSKKAGPLTRTALTAVIREAVKAGISLNDAITFCCEADWRGFNATWYADKIKGARNTTTSRHTGLTEANRYEDLKNGPVTV
jgi:hypothetical protein